MSFKEKVYYHFLNEVNEKIMMFQKNLADLKESGSNETKSTAGDKHETALAMLQIEQANVRAQLEEVLIKKSVLEKINPKISTKNILNGSLIKTNKGYLFMSSALGKCIIENVSVTALSSQSPLGKKLMGLKINDIAEVNNFAYLIEGIE